MAVTYLPELPYRTTSPIARRPIYQWEKPEEQDPIPVTPPPPVVGPPPDPSGQTWQDQNSYDDIPGYSTGLQGYGGYGDGYGGSGYTGFDNEFNTAPSGNQLPGWLGPIGGAILGGPFITPFLGGIAGKWLVDKYNKNSKDKLTDWLDMQGLPEEFEGNKWQSGENQGYGQPTEGFDIKEYDYPNDVDWEDDIGDLASQGYMADMGPDTTDYNAIYAGIGGAGGSGGWGDSSSGKSGGSGDFEYDYDADYGDYDWSDYYY